MKKKDCILTKRMLLTMAVMFAFLLVQAQPVVQEINKGWRFHEARLSTWHDGEVPGLVHTDLMKNDIIGDPFYRLNERGVQWVDKEDWEYETVFQAKDGILDKDHIILHCYGLDTYADVYVNDSLVIKADNMFREWKADVKGLLKSVDGEQFVVTVNEKRQVEGKKRPQKVDVDYTFNMNEVKYTKYLISFK